MFLESNIAYQNQTSSSEKLQALLSLKAQKTQDDSWFHCKQVQEMPLVAYQGQVGKGKVLASYPYKETRILLINAVGFSSVKVKLKYVESILNSIFSVVCFLL